MIESQEVGGKAKGLELLLAHQDLGFKVPEFDVLGVEHFQRFLQDHDDIGTAGAVFYSDDFKQLIMSLVKKYRRRSVIVRSSSLREDGELSFAGIYESYEVLNFYEVLNLNAKTLVDAITSVYRSFFSDKAIAYRNEHHVQNDEMAVIVQEFIESEWSGVMYTSNPSSPDDLVIEFADKRRGVVDGQGKIHVKEFDKRKRKTIFHNEHYPSSRFDAALLNIGIELEERSGPLDIEFLAKDKEIYLVQARKITDLKFPEPVVIPKYGKDQFLAESDIKRGTGYLTLPVVNFPDLDMINKKMKMIEILDKNAQYKMIQDLGNWLKQKFEKLSELNSFFKDGYVLVTPYFHETQIQSFAVNFAQFEFSGSMQDLSMDKLTSNKKAVITTKQASISSHVITIARERGIAYAGFEDGEDLFYMTHDGELLSIYFKGRSALIYREYLSPKSLRSVYPEERFQLTNFEDKEYVIFSASTTRSIPLSILLIQDFNYFLEQYSDQKWRFKRMGNSEGGVFVTKDEKAVFLEVDSVDKNFKASTKNPEVYELRIMNDEYPLTKNRFKPVSGNELFALVEGYKKHLELIP